MKRTINFILIAIFTLSVVSCSKDADDNLPASNFYSSVVSIIKEHLASVPKVDGRIFLVNDFKQTKYNESEANFSFQGIFPASTNYSVFDINGYRNQVCDNKFYASSSVKEHNLDGLHKDFFGQTCSFTIDEVTFCEDLYIPKQAIIKIPENSNLTFEKENGISFDLETDDGNTKPIVVVLQYVDENLEEGESILTKAFVLESNANSLSIPSYELDEFPLDENLILYVGCGNGKTIEYDNFKYSVEGINITYLYGVKII